MKKRISWAIKNLANRFGYDIKEYHPHYTTVLNRFAIKTVLDIGANNGQFAIDLHTRLPKARIYSFEPLKDVYNELIANMPNIPHFKAFNFALGEQNEESEINRSAFSPSSSLLPMAELHKKIYPKSIEIKKEKIVIKRLDDIYKNIEIEKPLMIKMDVQGYENKVILGGLSAISEACMILVETSFDTLYEGQPLFDDIYNILRPLGFTYYGNNGQHWNNKTGELIYEDSIFIKTK